jgi:hypothetical protein
VSGDPGISTRSSVLVSSNSASSEPLVLNTQDVRCSVESVCLKRQKPWITQSRARGDRLFERSVAKCQQALKLTRETPYSKSVNRMVAELTSRPPTTSLPPPSNDLVKSARPQGSVGIARHRELSIGMDVGRSIWKTPSVSELRQPRAGLHQAKSLRLPRSCPLLGRLPPGVSLEHTAPSNGSPMAQPHK